MTTQEIRDFRVQLLDDIFELSQDPVANPEELKARVDEFFSRLEAENGKE